MANSELRFATIEGLATYYTSNSGPAGLEYELAERFARELGVDLKVLLMPNARLVVTAIREGKADIGGPVLMSNTQLGKLQFGPSYLEAPQQLVYRRGNRRPDSIREVSDHAISIDSLHLERLKEKYPHFVWNAYYDKNMESLLKMVQDEEIQSTIATANMVNIYRHLFPDIRVAFDITPPQPLAWVYQRNDEKLHAAVTGFFKGINNSGEMERLIDLYYEHIDSFNYVDVRTFIRRMEERLSDYESAFRKAAVKYDLDWTLLAALAYQESHWQADAHSPTGVRGLMMLTEDTAKHVGIDDRLDPEQSIEGGARYLKSLLKKVPERIQQPDRLWFALAAYNIGFQHLEDARILTQQHGADPDRWKDVRQYLPLLSEEEWHARTRHGHARGHEPVRYVRKIRVYQDILRWQRYEKRKNRPLESPLQAMFINVPSL